MIDKGNRFTILNAMDYHAQKSELHDAATTLELDPDRETEISLVFDSMGRAMKVAQLAAKNANRRIGGVWRASVTASGDGYHACITQ